MNLDQGPELHNSYQHKNICEEEGKSSCWLEETQQNWEELFLLRDGSSSCSSRILQYCGFSKHVKQLVIFCFVWPWQGRHWELSLGSSALVLAFSGSSSALWCKWWIKVFGFCPPMWQSHSPVTKRMLLSLEYISRSSMVLDQMGQERKSFFPSPAGVANACKQLISAEHQLYSAWLHS